MPLIVSDTSPLNLLIQIGQISILESLFGRVVIPPEVALEMSHTGAPPAVRLFNSSLPSWVAIRQPALLLSLPTLDPGETVAISLAVELACPLLIDGRDGRAEAIALGVPVIGAIGVLERAADLGIVADLAGVHAAIRLLPFRVAEVILAASLTRHLGNRTGPGTGDP